MTLGMYRADHVGSLLRPPELLEARAQFADGKIDASRLAEVEDAAVLKALELQREAGIDVLTDGEYRRASWSQAATNSIDGLVPVDGSPIRRIFDEWRGPDAEELNQTLARARSMVAGSKISKRERFVARDAAFLREHAGRAWKITLPGPMSMAGGMWEPGLSENAYPTRFALAEDLADMVNDEFKALVKGGISSPRWTRCIMSSAWGTRRCGRA
jgi:5-methyltetrahydropteroyltriglutamate--homocysteine methyltransferase